jgi:hypothetical protein
MPWKTRNKISNQSTRKSRPFSKNMQDKRKYYRKYLLQNKAQSTPTNK